MKIVSGQQGFKDWKRGWRLLFNLVGDAIETTIRIQSFIPR